MCIDLSRLNRYVRRERYQSPTSAKAVADIASSEAKYFTVSVAANYLRAPYGLLSIAKHYNCRMAEAFEELTGFCRVVDDVVIYDKDGESHMAHVCQFLQ